MHTSFNRAALACALLASTALASPAFAQNTPPPFPNSDENGVDLTTGKFTYSLQEGSIGSGDGAVSLSMVRTSGYYLSDNWTAAVYTMLKDGTTFHVVDLGTRSDSFTYNGSSFTPTKSDGGRLELINGSYRYTGRDGTRIDFFPGNPGYPLKNVVCGSDCQLPGSITKPNGIAHSYFWELNEVCNAFDAEFNCLDGGTMARLLQVTSSTDNRVEFSYGTSDYYKRTRATFTNLASPPPSLPTVTYAYPASNVVDITDPAGRTWRITNSASSFALRRPGSSTDNLTATIGTGNVASAVTNHGVTTNYGRSVSGNIATLTITNALNQQTVVVSDTAIGRPLSVTDALNRKTSFAYDSSGRLVQATAQDGNYVQYSHDARGNVTQTQAVPKPSVGGPIITTSAAYPASCTTPSCNQPTSTTDARGNVTDYAYDPTHGGVVSITAPAAPNGVRPQIRFTYALLHGEYRITQISACQTQASCAGSADEVRTTAEYDASGNVTRVSSGAGDGSLTATQTAGYDQIGNLVTVDGPLAGTADLVRYRYNAARELVGTVSPDPDGGGALRHRAVRNTIDSRGLVTRVESGTVGDQSDAAWANFSAIDAAEIGYDSNFRQVTQALVAGGATHALVQTGYDALGRPECSAQRMNPGAFGSLPGACSLGAEGSFGPDRISRTVYDAAGQVTQVRTAVGTALESVDVSTTYTGNGKPQTVTDAENNRTSYAYDGHDRLIRTNFPVATKGALASSSTDYEELGYDAASNVTARRLRDGQLIGYSYDALGRMTLKDVPNNVIHEYDIRYAYDNLGRLLSATDTNPHVAGNVSIRFSWDALGRKLSEGMASEGLSSFQYDLAGRRTRMTWADGFFVTYEHLVTGEVTAIRESGGALVLASFGYDDLGRRTSLSRGNGTGTSYSFDPASRLSQLVENIGGTANDLTLGFSYNPASQITQNTRSNDGYAWTAHYNVNRPYASNGLNQYTQTGLIAPTYDARGNSPARAAPLTAIRPRTGWRRAAGTVSPTIRWGGWNGSRPTAPGCSTTGPTSSPSS